MMIASRHGNFPVKKGDKLAGTRIIPLVIEETKMRAADAARKSATGGKPILELKPFVHKKVGIITTGNEVFYGRIEDTFTPVIKEKLAEFDTEVTDHVIWNDDDQKVTASILQMIEDGADVICCTGGMSVDPDDRTPLAIKNTGARIVSYGAPVLPGAMFLLAYYEVKEGTNPRTVAILGLPGCVMYAKRTIFDLVLPRICADDEVTAEELAALGEGGLCLNCPTCIFPNCGFGKGN
jgi:molybdenum cofactor synthesis domain-containing protein